jgi:galactokinase
VSDLPTLRAFSDLPQIKARLVAKGLTSAESDNKAELFLACANTLHESGVDEKTAVRAFFVPGRIEVLGKHTDYAGGHSIIAATEKGFCIVAVQRRDTTLQILDVRCAEKVEFQIDKQLQPRTGHWSNYPMTVARRIAKNFPGPLYGADITFASDLPPAAGMAASSAMIVGFFLVLSAANNLPSRREYRGNITDPTDLATYLATIENGLPSRREYRGNITDPTDLATYLATIENGQTFGTLVGDKGVGTFGGSEDHTAILCCRAGTLSRYRYCPVQFERDIEFPSGHIFAVASSGVVAEKTGAAMEKYNRLSNMCRRIVEIWNKATGRSNPHLAAAIASSPNAADHLRDVLRHEQSNPQEMLKRLEHFLAESEHIIPAAASALAKSDLPEFGREVTRSQQLAETLLGNQVPETIFLAHSALELGAVAASAFGAGFGGSVWALTKAKAAEEFLKEWSALYEKQFPKPAANARFFLTRPGPAAFEL